MRIRILIIFASLLIFSKENFAQEINYISPLPNSKNNSIQTNIILVFANPINKDAGIEKFFTITANGQNLSFHKVEQNNPHKLILKTNQDLPIGRTIEVKLIAPVKMLDMQMQDTFSFSFTTFNKTKYDTYKDSEFIKLSPNKVITSLKESAGNSGTGRAIEYDINNQVPFHMTMGIGDTNDFFFLTSMYSPRSLDRNIIVNGKGEIVYDQKIPVLGNNFQMFYDSTFAYTLLNNNIENYKHIILNKEFKVIDTVEAGNGCFTDLHELIKDPKTGNYFLLGDRIINANLSDVIKNGNANTQLLDQVIQEVDVNGNVVWEWKCFDYLPVTDVVGVDLLANTVVDYIHCNSIMLDTDTTLLLSSRHLCEITRINRKTGAIIWRMGPNASTQNFTFLNDPGFTYQHNAQKLNNGHILLYDNGNFRLGAKYSRAVEYEYDEITMQVRRVWEYNHNQEVMAYFMGSVQRLPNGNTVIGWGADNPTLTEVDQNNQIVYEGSFPLNVMSYRVHKYTIPELIKKQQPKFDLPQTYSFCKLNDPNFENKLIYDLQNYVPSSISEDYQLYTVTGSKLLVTLEDTSNNFYSFNNRSLNYLNAGIKQKDTIVCSGKGVYHIDMSDNCPNSIYQWSNGSTKNNIDYPTSNYLNKIWVKTINGLQIQTDTIRLSVSPIEPFTITGNPVIDKPYQVFTYSIPYYKGFSYNWKAINGNIIGGFEGNAVQVQWGNNPYSYIQGTIIDTYGCVRNSNWDTIYYNSNPIGIDDFFSNTGVNVFPSPFNKQLQLSANTAFYAYILMDLNGKILFESKLEVSGNQEINTADLPSGIYLLEINQSGKTSRIKIVKE